MRKCLEGQRRDKQLYWIVKYMYCGNSMHISPRKFIMYNGEHSFLFVATNSLNELYTHKICDCYIREY